MVPGGIDPLHRCNTKHAKLRSVYGISIQWYHQLRDRYSDGDRCADTARGRGRQVKIDNLIRLAGITADLIVALETVERRIVGHGAHNLVGHVTRHKGESCTSVENIYLRGLKRSIEIIVDTPCPGTAQNK